MNEATKCQHGRVHCAACEERVRELRVLGTLLRDTPLTPPRGARRWVDPHPGRTLLLSLLHEQETDSRLQRRLRKMISQQPPQEVTPT